ncbi:MAG: hypothetical protein RLO80_03260 [Hyphomonas sp.]
MSETGNEAVFQRLGDILELERELLQTGRAAEVASLIEEKMEVLQDFEAIIETNGLSGVSHQERRSVERIVQMAEENAAHMDAVRNGLRHAIRRLENINSEVHVGSYGRGGSQLSFTNATGNFYRKA